MGYCHGCRIGLFRRQISQETVYDFHWRRMIWVNRAKTETLHHLDQFERRRTSRGEIVSNRQTQHASNSG